MIFNNISEIISYSQTFNQKNKELIKKQGVVFTAPSICKIIIDHVSPNIDNKICEPSVGKGIFVFILLEYFREKYDLNEIIDFIENRLFCFDISEEFITELKEMLNSYVRFLGHSSELNLSNIKIGDFLKSNDKYDIIIGNPPYVRIQNINKDFLSDIKIDLKSLELGNVDLYYAFIEKALKSSNIIGFIIPNSFIKNKSGKFLRNLIKKDLKYIYDFCTTKVWKKISTYTCIMVCDTNTYIDNVIYETSKKTVHKNKKEMNDDIWLFYDQKEGSKRLRNLINYCGGGIATLKDTIYKFDTNDEFYCYKNDIKIEKEICKKVIKATKCKTFNEYRWIIYPYDINNVIIPEDILMNKYPLCYDYLLSKKNELALRDNGKTSEYEAWYGYGRRQGLLKKKTGKQVILPLTFLKTTGIYYIAIPDDESCLVLSGILVDINDANIIAFENAIKTQDFYNYCEMNNKTLSDNSDSDELWLSVNTTTINKYSF